VAAPRFSILTPVFETPADVLAAMLGSVRRQGFGDWELCLVDDRSTAAHVQETLAAADPGDDAGRERRHRRRLERRPGDGDW
jgi:O-antigen biosynthesis protein